MSSTDSSTSFPSAKPPGKKPPIQRKVTKIPQVKKGGAKKIPAKINGKMTVKNEKIQQPPGENSEGDQTMDTTEQIQQPTGETTDQEQSQTGEDNSDASFLVPNTQPPGNDDPLYVSKFIAVRSAMVSLSCSFKVAKNKVIANWNDATEAQKRQWHTFFKNKRNRLNKIHRGLGLQDQTDWEQPLGRHVDIRPYHLGGRVHRGHSKWFMSEW
jgi:hypothetical protein